MPNFILLMMFEIGVSILAGSFPAVAGSGTDRIYAAGLSGMSASSGMAVSSHALGEKYLSPSFSLYISLYPGLVLGQNLPTEAL